MLQGTVAIGQTVVITLDSAGYGCLWDLKYVFSDGDEFDEYEIDICEIDDKKTSSNRPLCNSIRQAR